MHHKSIQLTDIQRDTWLYVASYQHKHGRSPLQCEITQHFGLISKCAVAGRLKALERKGYLERKHRAQGAIRLFVWPPAKDLLTDV